MIISHPTIAVTRAGIAQLATSAALAAFLPFMSGWRTLLTAELAVYLLLSGVVLVVYGSARRDLPFRRLATAWLPIGLPFLLAFIVLFGAGLAVAEGGNTSVGVTLLTAGYLALPARSVYRLLWGTKTADR